MLFWDGETRKSEKESETGFHIITSVDTIAAVVEKRVSATVATYGNTPFNDSSDVSDGSNDRR